MFPEVEVLQVIRTTLARRGNGKTTPIRAIIQYWSMDGELLVEIDSLPEYAEEDARSLRPSAFSAPQGREKAV